MSSKPERRRPAATSPLGRPQLTPAVEQLHVGDRSADPGSSEPANPGTSESGIQRTPESAKPGITGAANPSTGESRTEPRYAQYVRKEARVRDDQAAALVILRKKVAGQRTEKVEPITDNVLIRLAIDLLLAHSDRLHGDTEDELRAALLNPATRESRNH